MAKERFSGEKVRSFLKRKKIATLEDLKSVLKTTGTMTVFRKLRALEYLTSYSHRGKYYTLLEIPEFDELGLWAYQSVWFSKFGNLVETAKELVEEAEAGFTARELESILNVECKRALLTLFQDSRVYRKKMQGVYVYVSADQGTRKGQILLRKGISADAAIGTAPRIEALSHELKAAIILFFSLLDEKQRRLYAGLESFKIGYGGDCKIAELLGVNVHTVARGRNELFSGHFGKKGVRQKGAGRKETKKKRRKS
jgi:hypothetical protein